MDYFYDAQFKNLLSQFTRIFNVFKYKTGINHTGKEELLPIPCILGSYSRIQGVVSRKNSQNVALTAPFISCWISSLNVARNRTGNADHISQMIVSEKRFNYEKRAYENSPGDSVLVERLMPIPYDIVMQVDIWSTNEEMKLQILEQILTIFNPSIDLQKNENPFDWSSKLIIELENINYSSRSVPIGNDDAMEVTTLMFRVENFYLNPPAKVKKLKLINQIYQNFYTENNDTATIEDLFNTVTTFKNSELRVIGDEATLVTFSSESSWDDIFTNNGQTFQGDGYYKALLYPNEYITSPIILNLLDISSSDPSKMLFELNANSLPAPNLPNVDDFINPNVLYPNNGLDTTIGKTYIIMNDINPNTEAWGTTMAKEGSIIRSIDGINFEVIFDSTNEPDYGQIVKNETDGNLYIRLTDTMWVDIYQATYRPGFWRIVSVINDEIAI